MGGVTKSDFEWRFIFEKSALNFEFQTRLFVFSVHPAWSFNLELLCVLVCFCAAFWCVCCVCCVACVACVACVGCVCVAPGQSLERWPLSTCRWTSSCWHAELPNLYWIFSSENGPLQMTEPFHSPRQNYAILKKDARARARARATSSIFFS